MLLRLITAVATWGLSCVFLLVMPIPQSAAEFTADEYASYAARLANTPHDFVRNRQSDSSSESRADGDQTMCIFCHTPFGSGGAPPLWTPAARAAIEFPVFGSLRDKRGGRPEPLLDSSLICLGCHDGMGGASFTVSILSDHPVGVNYPVNELSLEFRAVSGWTDTLAFFDKNANGKADIGEIRLYRSATGTKYTVECSSCHDAHGRDKEDEGLVKENAFLRLSRMIISDICVTCHVK